MDAKRARINTDTKQLAKPMKQLEAERREEGLNTAISSNNKGFEMLTKMGYKPGESLGRSSSGIVEPITIQLKTDRGGLGRAAAIKQLEEYKEKLRQARAEKKTEDTTNSICQFRQRMAEKTGGKLLESDLWYFYMNFERRNFPFFCVFTLFLFYLCHSKCQRACEKLDLDASIEAPAMLWFWPIRKTNDPSETSEDPYDQTNEEQPKRKRAVSSSDEDSSDDVTEPKGRFGDFSDTDDSSQSAQIDGVIEEFETIDTTNDNRNATDVENESEIEYEVMTIQATGITLYYDELLMENNGLFSSTGDRKAGDANELFANNLLLLPMVWYTLQRCG